MTQLSRPMLVCDLTQSYAPHGGGGVSTYLREKREHFAARTEHRLLQIVPGPEDRVVETGRHIWVEIGAPPVRGSPNYHFIMRTRAVREVLERYRPDVIESLCPWVLPWTAINYRRANPESTLVAGYHTDFPNAHIHGVSADLFGSRLASGLRRLSASYAEMTYREFDRVYTLGEDMRRMLHGYGVGHVDVLDLAVDTGTFHPARRVSNYREQIGLSGNGPLLIYAGRLDNEKKVDVLIKMIRRLPRQLGAALVMAGDGKLRLALEAMASDLPISFQGYIANRGELARALASADIYVSAMPNETFGISVVEAQACALPVVGVASGAMIERVPPALGLLAPPGNSAAMARHVETIWSSDHRAMGQAARTHVVERFCWRRTFDRLLTDVYAAAMAQTQERLRAQRHRSYAWMAAPLRRAG
jgi:alpha-1,6-mannosyltransferase